MENKPITNFPERVLRTILSRPRLVVFLILGITLFFAFQLPRAHVDNNNLRFVPEDDEARITSRYIDDTFGSSLFILVGLERKYGTVFDRDFLNLIRDYTRRLEDIPIIGNINSIISSDYIFAEGDSIVVQKLVDVENFSGTPEEIAELKRRLLSWDLYQRSLISDDYSATQVLVPLEIIAEDAGKAEVIDSFILIRDIAREMFAGKAEVYVTGLPVISATINEAVRADLIVLIPLVIIVVLVVLFFSFRQFTAVILPLLTVLIAVIWCMGAMPLLGVDLSVISTVLPVILVAVGSAYGIHVVTHYIEDMKESGAGLELSKEEHRDLIIRLSLRIGQAVFLAALTTLMGFMSFCFTRVLPIREFGFFSGFGVLVSYLVAVTLIPSLLLIRGPKPLTPKKAMEGRPENEDRNIERFFMPIIRKRKTIIVVLLGVLGLSVYGVSKIVIDNVFVEYFRTSTDISRSDKFIRDKFGGSKIVSVVASAETSELLSPDSLKAMDELSTYLETKIPETGKTLGFTHLIKRINQVYNAEEDPEGIRETAGFTTDLVSDTFGGFGFGDFGFGFDNDTSNEGQGFGNTKTPGDSSPNKSALPGLNAEQFVSLMETALGSGMNRTMNTRELAWELQKLINYQGASYYEIPTIPEKYGKRSAQELQQIVSNYLILLSGNIGAYADDPLEPTAIKTTIQLRTLGEKDTGIVINEIADFINANFPAHIKTIMGGSAFIESSLNNLVVHSQLISVFVSIFLVFIILTVCNHSLAAGLIGIMPLSITVLINFAIMGFLGIKLNIGTSMVASVSVGIGIDYTIHYIEAFKREYLAAEGKGDFLIRTYATSGKAILINALSVGAGFVVLLFSQFLMLQHLGLLIAITMGTCALTSLTVIPVLLMIFKPRFIYKYHSQWRGAAE